MQSKHNYNGNFCTAQKKLIDLANKALYALYRKIRNLAIPIDLQLKLFDLLITPILVYSCEVWGFENKQGIEKMHLQYCKRILNLRSSTPNFMVYGKIGRFPVEIINTFWNNMLCNNNKLLKLPIKTGRWANILKQNRKCHLCNLEMNFIIYLFVHIHKLVKSSTKSFVI
jgi:hypothetical protein